MMEIKFSVLIVLALLLITSCTAIRIGSPGEARDVITVCASSRDGDMAFFSSRGPTRHGYIKPDICAPGLNIMSTVPERSVLGEGNLYRSLSGTSMATPVVSGSAAIIMQKYVETHGTKPSPEYVKAALLYGAQKIQMHGKEYASLHQGSGVVDIMRSVGQVDSERVLVEVTPDVWHAAKLTTGGFRDGHYGEPLYSRGLVPGDIIWQKFILVPGQSLPNVELRTASTMVRFAGGSMISLGDVSRQMEFVAYIVVPEAPAGMYDHMIEVYSAGNKILEIPVSIQIADSAVLTNGVASFRMNVTPSTHYITYDVPADTRLVRIDTERSDRCADAYVYDNELSLHGYDFDRVTILQEQDDRIDIKNPTVGTHTLAITSMNYSVPLHPDFAIRDVNCTNNPTVDVNISLHAFTVEPRFFRATAAPDEVLQYKGTLTNSGVGLTNATVATYCGNIEEEETATETIDIVTPDFYTEFTLDVGYVKTLNIVLADSSLKTVDIDARVFFPDGSYITIYNDEIGHCEGGRYVFPETFPILSMSNPPVGEYRVAVRMYPDEFEYGRGTSCAGVYRFGTRDIHPQYRVVEGTPLACPLMTVIRTDGPLAGGAQKNITVNISVPTNSILDGEIIVYADGAHTIVPVNLIPKVGFVGGSAELVLQPRQWGHAWFSVPSNALATNVTLTSPLLGLSSDLLLSGEQTPQFGVESRFLRKSAGKLFAERNGLTHLTYIDTYTNDLQLVNDTNGDGIAYGEIWSYGVDLSMQSPIGATFVEFPVPDGYVSTVNVVPTVNNQVMFERDVYVSFNHEVESAGTVIDVGGVLYTVGALSAVGKYKMVDDLMMLNQTMVFLQAMGDTASTDNMYLDSDADGDFTDELALKAGSVTQSGPYSIKVRLSTTDGVSTVMTVPITVGTLSPSNSYVVELVDMKDSSGVNPYVFVAPVGHDAVFIDFDRDYSILDEIPLTIGVPFRFGTSTYVIQSHDDVRELFRLVTLNVSGISTTALALGVFEESTAEGRGEFFIAIPLDERGNATTSTIFLDHDLDNNFTKNNFVNFSIPFNISNKWSEFYNSESVYYRNNTERAELQRLTVPAGKAFGYEYHSALLVGLDASGSLTPEFLHDADFDSNFAEEVITGLGGKYRTIDVDGSPREIVYASVDSGHAEELETIYTHGESIRVYFGLDTTRFAEKDRSVDIFKWNRSNTIFYFAVDSPFQSLYIDLDHDTLFHGPREGPYYPGDIIEIAGQYYKLLRDSELQLQEVSLSQVFSTVIDPKLWKLSTRAQDVAMGRQFRAIESNGVFSSENAVSGTIVVQNLVSRAPAQSRPIAGTLEYLEDGQVLHTQQFIIEYYGEYQLPRFTEGKNSSIRFKDIRMLSGPLPASFTTQNPSNPIPLLRSYFTPQFDATIPLSISMSHELGPLEVNLHLPSREIGDLGSAQYTLELRSATPRSVNCTVYIRNENNQQFSNATHSVIANATLNITAPFISPPTASGNYEALALCDDLHYDPLDIESFAIVDPTGTVLQLTLDQAVAEAGSTIGFNVSATSRRTNVTGTLSTSIDSAASENSAVVVPFTVRKTLLATQGMHTVNAVLTYSYQGNQYVIRTSKPFYAGSVYDIQDYDGDGQVNGLDPDDDNDGHLDTVDNLLGDSSHIVTNTLLGLFISNSTGQQFSTSTAGEFRDRRNIRITHNGSLLLETSYDFGSNVLPLRSVRIQRQGEGATVGSLIVSGLGQVNKTLYVENVHPTFESVCIKDAEVLSLSEISAGCNGASETVVNCNGALHGRYTCSPVLNSTYYKVTGLQHSAVVERNVLASIPSPGSPGGGGGGGGGGRRRFETSTAGSLATCTPEWTCGQWGACINGVKGRSCTDAAKCNTVVGRPAVYDTCAVASVPPVQTPQPVITPSPAVQPLIPQPAKPQPIQPPSQSNIWPLLLVIAVALVSIGALVMVVMVMSGGKEKKYVRLMRGKGYTDDQISTAFKNQGFTEEEIEGFLK